MYKRVNPTPDTTLTNGKTGNKNRTSLCPKQEYSPTNPTKLTNKGIHQDDSIIMIDDNNVV
eukprot:scaffold3632_cov162-Amphora_coffeaeformis.AAC.12